MFGTCKPIWKITTCLLHNDDGSFEVGCKSGFPTRLVTTRNFADFDKARDFAKVLTIRNEEGSFVEIYDRSKEDGYTVHFLGEE